MSLSRWRHGARFLLGAAAMAAGFAAAPGAAEELKLAHFMSPRHPMHQHMMAPMAATLETESGGALTIKIYPGGALGKGPREQYNRAVDGIADITFGLAGYTSPQFPRVLLAELPGIAATPAGATAAIWRAYPDHLKDDFGGVKMLALWTGEASILITRDKPVRKLEDLAGLKIRVPSKTAATVVESWGAVPQTMPVTKVYTSMQTGVIDGVYIGSSGIGSFKLAEVGKYFTTNLPPAYTVFYLIMNKGAWAGLSGDKQAMLDKVSGAEASAKAAAAYGRAGESGLAHAKQAGREIIALSDAEQARFAAAAQSAIEATLAAREAAGIPAREIVAAMTAE